MKKKVHIMTFGCQMNEHDSERIAGLLHSIGYCKTAAAEEADMILLNTCSIREKAEHKLFSQLGKLRPLKLERPDLILGVCGCVAQQEAENIFKRAPYVDLVLGTRAIPKLPMLLRALEFRPRVLDVSESAWNDESQSVKRECRFKAFITIIRGCNNFCTYCVVPYTRGREESRAKDDILTEARRLIDDGVMELTLLGQNVSSYRYADEGISSFPNLLRALNELDGLQRLRFITAHPKDLTDELISTMAELPTVCEHFHLPVQSGSNRILGLMNRCYTREWYLDRIRLLRDAIPDIAVTTDIIAGFPGETEEDFQETLAIQSEVRYDGIFAFKYSIRPNAQAGSLPDQVPESLKSARLQRVFELQREINLEKHQRLTGKQVEVLPEAINPRFPDTLTGRTRTNHLVTFKGPEKLLGQLVQVDITDGHHFRLAGKLAEDNRK
ncbi:tRNA (N6-isopentenyl adenosine(37)-C2)-methylthiotransferase MiaB [candidate division KSB3 bacterium]|uniref:tRNA-2-methylthio-N(6)-dimethylallyladenosine synthase n=1 Tax=candidate division KSB3 bacterium TaxID=2044937 RepID=A0A2G6E6Z7_9BACT|nr:MAG: tRNA (N6-isopentenyl adenosine(37)-C2)-methylthiotransferase MiaB [candidate division KSB3 bacterium]PIE30046.1 MAG: tRNA (N6-isopentenyl adenosine(37)-C2)-methylthiotransferase MiaB [candidate division KSB3 bacterium]